MINVLIQSVNSVDLKIIGNIKDSPSLSYRALQSIIKDILLKNYPIFVFRYYLTKNGMDLIAAGYNKKLVTLIGYDNIEEFSEALLREGLIK